MKTVQSRLLIMCLAFAALAGSESRPGNKPFAPSHKLVALKASGTTTYNDQEILGASGLRLGQDAAEGDFKEAAQRLIDSGMFSDVVYSFSYSDTGVKVDFQLSDTDKTKLVPARFDNFVWFTDAELLASLDRRLPLFKQLLPLNGKLSEEVAEALQAILTEKQLPGRVGFMREGEDQTGGDLIAIAYRVDEVTIRIHKVEFPGASPEQAAFLAGGARKLNGSEYSRSSIAANAKFDLLPLYRERGYLKATFGPSDAHVLASPPTTATAEDQLPPEIEVDASIPVNPGEQYRVSSVSWKGTSAVTLDEAAHLFHLNVGQPADAVVLAADVEALTKLYHHRGYMTAQIKPDTQFDDAKATVHYDMNVSEGEQYKMGEVEILGLDPGSRDRLREAWTLREGQPYDADYASKFVHDASRFFLKAAQFRVEIELTLDAKDKLVDVTIHYKPQ
jgi:outer membrane protein assembly factor BamA